MMKRIFHTYLAVLLVWLTMQAGSEKSVRGARPFGFFADFLLALNHLEYCTQQHKIPVIYWGESFAYYSPSGYNGSKNGWEYYFEPVSDASYEPSDQLLTAIDYQRVNTFSTAWWYVHYLDYKFLLSPQEQLALKPIEQHEQLYASAQFQYQRRHPFPVGNYHLYSKVFRNKIKTELIDRFITIKPTILEKVDDFFETHLAGKKTIGIHLRGENILNEVLPVPLEYIVDEANNYADRGYQFFIATDQYPLLCQAQNKLRGPVIFYECERFAKTTSPNNEAGKLSPQQGQDLLIETLLLSKTDHLIHTLSNVSTTALYFNPELEHTLLY